MTATRKRISRRHFIAAAAAGTAVSALSGTVGSARGATRPVRIGFSMPKTGYLGIACPVAEQAYFLWRDQMNAAGGLAIAGEGRRPVEFVEYDDQSEPAKTAQIYEKLISEDKVDLLFAPYATPFHIAIAPVIERHKFPLVGNTAGSTLLRDLHAKHMWFVDALADKDAAALVSFLKSQKVKSIALLTLQLPLSLEIKKFATPLLDAAGIKISVNLEYPPDIKDMTSMLSSVKNAAPDAVIGLSYPGDSILYMSQAREMGIPAKIQMLLIGPTEPFFMKKFGAKDTDHIVTIGRWSPKQTKWPEGKAFYDAYVARWKEPPDYEDSISTYISCQVMEQAVAKAGLEHEKIRQTIVASTFETANGPVRFEGAENVATPAGLLQIQNGGMEIIWPESIATSNFMPKSGWSS
jgi:branched-chain amino acid transport system substrate-binding protein